MDIATNSVGVETEGSLPLRVLVYEPAHGGHHLPYLQRMLPGFFGLPVHLGLATTEAAVMSEEYRLSIKPIEDRLEVMAVCRPRPRSQLLKAWQRTRELASLAKSWRADHVLVVYADGIWLISAAARLLGIQLMPRDVLMEAWIFRGSFSYPGAGSPIAAIKRFLFRNLLQRGIFQKVHLEDELLMEYAQQIDSRKSEIVLAPDPVMVRAPLGKVEARQRLGLPLEGRIISTSGMISRRKGGELVLDAFARMLEIGDDQNVRLLLAGPHAAEVRNKLAAQPFAELEAAGRILVMDRFLDENEMLLVAEASDLVLAAYLNHSGRSSILLWGALAGKPIVGTNYGTIEYVIKTQRLGATCDVCNVDEFADTMRRALDEPWTEDDARRVSEYARWHRIENYQQLSSEFVRARCCLDGADGGTRLLGQVPGRGSCRSSGSD